MLALGLIINIEDSFTIGLTGYGRYNGGYREYKKSEINIDNYLIRSITFGPTSISALDAMIPISK